MIHTHKELKFYIEADKIIAGYYDRDKRKKIIDFIFTPPILKYLKHLRCCSYYKHKTGVFNLLKFCYHFRRYRMLGLQLGFDIGYDVFGYGLHIPHPGTIIVNSSCQIGNYAVIHTSTCIGGADKVIGNGFYVGSGAMVMGTLRLGDGVCVASQSLVNKSYEGNNLLLAGVPAMIKKYNNPIWYEYQGDIYKRRVNQIEELKIKMKV